MRLRRFASFAIAGMMACTCFAGMGNVYAQTDMEAAKAALDEANEKVLEAQGAYDEAKAAYNNAGRLFIEEKAGAGITIDALTQCCKDNKELKEYTDTNKYEKSLASALSVSNLNKAADYVTECNTLRAKHHKDPLIINYRLTAIASVSVAVSSYHYNHAVVYEMDNGLFESLEALPQRAAENLAWGYFDPFNGWYDTEKEHYDEYVASGKYPGLENMGAYDVYMKYPEISGDFGHYLNIIDNYAITGFATSSASGCDGQMFYFDADYGENATPEQFKKALADYVAPYEEAKASAKTDLDNAKDARDAAQATYDACFISLKGAKVTGIKDKVYTGKAITQAVKVTADGKTLAPSDYSITYSNNKKVGLATLKISGKGMYKDSISKTFKILPKGTTVSKLTPAKKAFIVKWKKKAYTGYQIRYSLKSSMASSKTVKVTKASTVSKKITKLKAKKKYYVQVRTYKTVKGKNYYSKWSGKKTVRTK